MYCQKCGSQIEDQSTYCPNCGAKVGDNSSVVTKTEQAVYTNGKKMHCPKCKGNHLQVAATSSGSYTGGNAGRVGRTTIMSGITNTTYQHSWFCADCGNQFRDPDELKKEIKDNKSIFKPFLIIGIISGILFLLSLSNLITGFIGIGILLPVSLFFIIIAFGSKYKYKKATEEYEYLSRNCFD